MKVTKEKVENRQAFLNIEIDADEVEEARGKAHRRLANELKIPGFRKGKVPLDVLERYLGKENFLREALDHYLPQAYEKALKEAEITAFARGQVEITQTDPVVVKATVPLAPEVELGDYHSLRMEPPPAEVNDVDINAIVEQLRHQNAVWEPVERPVELDDLLIMNVESQVDGKSFLEREGYQYQVIKNQTFPVLGFSEQMLGMTQGEEKEFTLQFPADERREDLAGKDIHFKVKVVEVKKERLPELNDEFAQQVNPDFKTLDELREQVVNHLKADVEGRVAADFEGQVIEAAVGLCQVDFPPVLAEMEVERLLQDEAQRLQWSGLSLEDYLRQANRTEAELREEMRSRAEQRVTQALVLDRVAEEAKIEVSDAEVDTEIEQKILSLTGGAGENKDKLEKMFNTPQSRQSVQRYLVTRKAVQHLVGIARQKEETTEKEEKSE